MTVTDTDDDTGQGSHAFTVTVRNVAPSVLPVPQTFLVGRSETKLIATFTDPGALDTHTVSINWGDGTAPSSGAVTETLGNVAGVLTTGSTTGTHTYSVAGPFPRTFVATITVTDKDGGATSIPVIMTVTDLEIPNITLSRNPATIVENGSTTLTGNFGGIVFPVGATVFSPAYQYSWDFGNGVTTAWAAANPGTNIVATPTYLNDGVYTATFNVRALRARASPPTAQPTSSLR